MHGTGRVKKLKNYMGYQVDFLLPLKLQKYAILGYATKYSWSISLQDFLLLLLLVNLNTVIHCYTVFVASAICELVLKLTMVTPRTVIQLESCIN